ncbi:MAG: phosphatidate cytidylyltransferase [Alphaproteobacteria bacterium]
MAARTADRGQGDLGPRVMAAVVLVPAAVAATVAGGWVFAGLALAAALGLAWEWRAMTGASAAVMGVGILAAWSMGVWVSIVAALGYVALFVGLTAALAFAARARHGLLWAALGIAYVALPMIALLGLRQRPHDGTAVVLFLFAVVWATDAGAYFVGRAIGGAPLAPRWSPRKTRSGALGGLAAAALVGIVAALAGLASNPWLALAVALALSVAAQIGDLLESIVKRRYHRKDSGRMIPGHGGLFDRLDSLLVAAPGMAVVMAAGGVTPWFLRGGL